MTEPADRPRATLWQRRSAKRLAAFARKNPGQPLEPGDWEAYFRYAAQPRSRVGKSMMRALPSSPRCGFCGAPFGGLGARVVKPLGYRPSRKNPNVCAVCVELAPPGGTTTEAGVLFADLRGFTAASDLSTPAETAALLRRFYGHAERVLFPEALIDKLIGDEVMALYLPIYLRPHDDRVDEEVRRETAALIVGHALDLLRSIGYGTSQGPEFEVGIGVDYGEVFVGNIGDEAVHDFTAIGDVVNTAARLQHEAAGGEVVVSGRLAAHLAAPPGPLEQLELRGKVEPVAAYRLTV